MNWSNSGVLCESRANRTPLRASPRCKYVPWILISCDVLPRGDNIDPPPPAPSSRATPSLWVLVTSQGIHISSSSLDVERLLGTASKNNFRCYRSVSLLYNNIYLTAIGLSPGGSGFKHIYKYLTLSTKIYIYIGGGST